MPQIFKVGSYFVYFWSNESNPLEPIHVHISSGEPTEKSTKVWITKTGRCLLCNNRGNIPPKTLKNIMRVIEARSEEIKSKWYDYFGAISYYC